MLPESKLVKEQVNVWRKDLDDGSVLVVIVRWDDECGNGRNIFSVTANLYDRDRFIAGEECVVNARGEKRWLGSCGCLHEEVAKHFPGLAPVLKWHLVGSDGPIHYIANAMHHASDKDCWGLREGEKRQIVNGRTGLAVWHLVAIDANGEEVMLHDLDKYIDAVEAPDCPYRLEYRPCCLVGEGKPVDLDAARSCAVWPDATLEQLQDKDALEARLPALMEEFKRDVENLGFVY